MRQVEMTELVPFSLSIFQDGGHFSLRADGISIVS
jgi:hypothetical protein